MTSGSQKPSKESEVTPEEQSFSRRNFIALGITATAGLALGLSYKYRKALFSVPPIPSKRPNTPTGQTSKSTPPTIRKPEPSSPTFEVNAFVLIPTKGKVKIYCHRSEMGQGIRTAVPMLLAEELGVTMDQVEVLQAKGDPKYGNQNTDGSRSITKYYTQLRQLGASAREMLVQAAATQWKVKPKECQVKDGFIFHARSKKKLAFGEVAEAASKLSLPKQPRLKKEKDFQVIGKATPGQDLAHIVQGKAPFGIDTHIPGMLYGCAQRSPIPGGKIKTLDASAAMKIPGVVKVVSLPAQGPPVNSNASVCVLAQNTWAAMQGKKALKLEWDLPKQRMQGSAAYKKSLQNSLERKTIPHRAEGDVKAVFRQQGAKIIKSSYHTPFLVHAPMEPLVSTAHIKGKTCEVWAPCQDPVRARRAIAKFLGIRFEDVTFHVTFLGGGFGRKSQPDFVLETVAAAKKIGKPVKLTWTREDEIKHGFYHAESYQQLTATLGKDGTPNAWHHQTIFPTLMSVFVPGSNQPAKFEMGLGATNMPYRIPNVLVETGYTHSPVRVGWLRSVCNLFHAFGINSFIDELAGEVKADPIEYRLKMLGKPRTFAGADSKRMTAVIQQTKKAFGWEKPLPKGHGKGFANHYSFRSYIAVAVEASLKNKTIQVHRVVFTIDCGLAVNPEGVKAQMESSAVFGLSAAIHGKITLRDGVVEQSNFHDYPVLRMNEMPKVEVHIINGDTENPTGVGEPGVPPIPSALAAALFQITGKRMRNLPFNDDLG